MKILSFSFLSACLILLTACAPYQDKSYFEPVKTSNYQLNDFKGETGFSLDASFTIPAQSITSVSFDSFDGNNTEIISGIYVGDSTKISSNPVIVYCHDKFGNIDYYWQRIKLLAKLGLDEFGILIIDYRGYGTSSGSTTEGSMNADVAAAIRWLESKGLTSDRLILYGYGLGSAPVVEIAANPRTLSPAKIILEAPIASMELLLQDALYQSVPADYFTGLKFNNADKIKNVTQPLLWFHGEQDNIYPVEHGQLVFDSHPGVEGTQKLGFRINNADHDNIPAKISPLESDSYNQYLLDIRTFFENY